ncbi:type II toxin-antitoxin system Phd/YefM family antitoxin [Crocosphaera sp.]|uniref:type II toxin-antitoxin system Phd/YefM family antitoxin n=1 Tax=Crocosphaera sp. TaxID=2729996 RepID=UPI003F2925F1|nr:type II toxin-antitoxin system Phd/YefM family antitoxin [Crocosphaera sp.]
MVKPKTTPYNNKRNPLILIMEIVSITEVTQTLPSVIRKVQKEPVIIHENDREIAVIMSIEDYKRLTEANIQEFQMFRKKLANKAQERGLTEDIPLRESQKAKVPHSVPALANKSRPEKSFRVCQCPNQNA